jgi:hypothetical protein
VSKFSGLRGLKQSEIEPVESPAPAISATQNSGTPETRKPGRPRAKRSDPEYTQVTAYIRRDTYMAVKRKLLDLDDAEFSDTLEELLSEWLRASK